MRRNLGCCGGGEKVPRLEVDVEVEFEVDVEGVVCGRAVCV